MQMHLSRSKASDKTNLLKAVYRRIEAMEKKMDEARSEEAAQSDQQQECILRGGVYLRHRLKKWAPEETCLLNFSYWDYYNTIVRGRASAGVQAYRRARSYSLQRS